MSKKIDEVMGLVEHYAVQERIGNEDGATRFLEAIEAKLSELLPVWQPIETAPKDGSEVLAGFQSQFKWVTGIAIATKSHGVYASGFSKFTHFMPLPKSPE